MARRESRPPVPNLTDKTDIDACAFLLFLDTPLKISYNRVRQKWELSPVSESFMWHNRGFGKIGGILWLNLVMRVGTN